MQKNIIRYTARDVIRLREFLPDRSDYFLEPQVIAVLRKKAQEGPVDETEVNMVLRRWLYEREKDHGWSTVVRFVFDTPARMVPKYVNDKSVAPFFRWRLAISK